MTLTLTAIVAGIGVGAVYGLIAIGFTVVFNTTRVFNLAQGDLVMVGVMGSWYLLEVTRWPQGLVFVTVTVAVAALSVIEERLIIRPFLKQGQGNLGWFISTLAFALIIETIVQALYGQQVIHPIPSFIHSAAFHIGDVSIAPVFVVATAALVIVGVAIEIFYARTWLGVAMRGCADDREGALLRGIDPRRMGTYAFLISGAIAGAAGFVLGPIVSSDSSIGLTYTIQGFIALAIGGFGSIRGAVVGALCLGVADQVFDRFSNSNYEIVVGLGLMLVLFLVKPTGLFGPAGARRI